MVYCDTLAECQLLGRVEGRVEGTPGLAPDPGRGALHPAACSHTAHTAVRRSTRSGFVITRIEMGISPAFCCSPPLHTFIHITQVPHPTPESGS